MRVHAHTKFCFLCVLTFLFHQCTHCHGEAHHHHEHAHEHDHTHDDRQISQAPYLGATPSPGSKSPPGDALEEEQRFYIQQLFSRYGEKDRLDFQGFQRLLMSLGLGQLKVVGMEHDELGHDHVAHLDALEVQEGLHSHLPTHEGHGHKHPHSKVTASHPDHPHTHAEQRPTQGASPPSGSGPRMDHDHKHENDYNHDHDHENCHGHEGEHIHDHDETKVEKNEHKHTHTHEEDNDHRHHHDHHGHQHEHDHDHENDHDRKPPRQTQSADVHTAHQEQPPSAQLEPSQGPQEQPTETTAADVPSSLVSGSEVSAAPTVPAVGRNKRPVRKQAGRGQGRERGRNKTAVPVSSPPPAVHHKLKHDLDHDNDHEQTHEREQGHNHDHDHSHDGSHSHKKKREAPAPGGPVKPTVPTHAVVEQRRLKHDHDHDGNHEQNHDHDHDHTHNHNHGRRHSLKKKREAPSGPVKPTVPALTGHPDGIFHQHEECLNLTQLLSYYGLSPDSLISPDQFTFLCPALLYQIDMRVCIHHYHQMGVEEAPLEHVNPVWVWVWGFVSITIISLLSLLGVVLVPILNQSCFKFLLTFLVALAVGTLSGDALLHLLPHSQGQHDHSNPGEPREEQSMLVEFDGVWKGLTALSGIYLLFIIEHCIGMFKHYKDQGGRLCGRKRRSDEAKIGRKLSDHKLNRRSDAEWLNLKPLTEGHEGTAVSCDNGHNDTQLSELQPPDSPTNKTPLAPADTTTDHHAHHTSPAKAKKHHGHRHGHGHSHGGNCHSDQEMKDAGIASIAWMVIMGDGMHNFSDGLAIGAAFSANTTGGISTSVAVFCHELPHELGDFAVLLKAGMSVKQAIVYNLLSALMAYVGMLIGIAVGQNTHNVTNWIFAVTAGMFLYVALVDMLPEMLHGDSEEHKRCHMGHFILQNIGMLTGFAIMLLIAIFEDQIVLDFGF